MREDGRVEHAWPDVARRGSAAHGGGTTRPASHRAAGTRGAAPLACAMIAALAACDGTTSTAPLDGVLGSSTLTGGGGAGGGTGGGTTALGARPTVVRGPGELVGSWTRVSGGAGTAAVLTEQTWTFLADGNGVRSTVTRTALGVAIAVEQAPFTWVGSGGVLSLRFARRGAADVLVRASYVVLADLGATVLRLDGLDYQRTGG